jgi:hypothetical protein
LRGRGSAVADAFEVGVQVELVLHPCECY